MSDIESEEINVSEKDFLEDPFAEENGMIDLLIADEPFSKIKKPKEDLDELVSGKEPPPIPRPIVSQPTNLPSVNISQPSVSINVRRDTALDKIIGDPRDNDVLLGVIRDNRPTSTILNSVMEEIAEEAAFIKAWRNKNWDSDKDLSDATLKRIKMLKNLVETITEREKLRREDNIGKVDFHGEAFQRVLKYFLEVIQKTFRKINIPKQYEDIFFPELGKEFDNFEKQAEKIYYGKD